MQGLANLSLLSDLLASLKSSLIEFIRCFAASGVFLYISESDEFTQGLVSFSSWVCGLFMK